MGIDKYSFGATCGQTLGKFIDEDKERYINGEFDELAVKVAIKSFLLQMKILDEVKNHPVLGLKLDANLKL